MITSVQPYQYTFKAKPPIKTKQVVRKTEEMYPKQLSEKINSIIKRPAIWNAVDNFVKKRIQKLKHSKFSSDPRVRSIEYNLHNKGVNIRFNEDLDLARFMEAGIKTLQEKNIKCPPNIFFVTPKIKKLGISGATYNLHDNPNESPVILTKDIAATNDASKLFEQGISSTDNPYHIFFHEVGHWLLFSNKYDAQESCQIFENEADKESIIKEVSEMGISTNDGSDFCSEYFAAKMIGKTFSEKTENLAKKLNAPLSRK